MIIYFLIYYTLFVLIVLYLYYPSLSTEVQLCPSCQASMAEDNGLQRCWRLRGPTLRVSAGVCQLCVAGLAWPGSHWCHWRKKQWFKDEEDEDNDNNEDQESLCPNFVWGIFEQRKQPHQQSTINANFRSFRSEKATVKTLLYLFSFAM